jgi:hypothetical protein
MVLAGQELPRRLLHGLFSQAFLLPPNPFQSRRRKRFDKAQSCRNRGGDGNAAIGRVDSQVRMLDALS